MNFNTIKRHLLVLSLILLIFPAVAQVNTNEIEFREKNFPGREKEFNAAFEAFRKGDGFFFRGPNYYEQALEQYLKAQEFNSNSADLNYQIGLCYLSLGKDRLNALPFLERAKTLRAQMGSGFMFDLGIAYQYGLDFEKAIKVFEAYIDSLGAKAEPNQLARADKAIRECESGIELVKSPVRVRIENLGPNINSKFADYAPVLTEDENKIMFTSRREGTTGNLVDPSDSMYLEDIYLSYRVDGDWAPARNVGKPINSTEHDGTINLSPDGKKLLIYRTVGGGDIFESTQEGIEWSAPKGIKEINSKDYENHAAYSIDGKTLFFISNRADSENEKSKDIYLADVSDNGKISNIRNAGEIVNTKYEEDGVFCHPDGKTVYFSSRGHNTMGGFDIFKTTFENGVFSAPINVGYPINSPEDDVFFILSKDGKRAYFSSYRDEGFGDKDIYVMHFLTDVEALSSLQFSISDTTAGMNLQAIIEIRDLSSGQIIVKRETENGETIANVPAGKAYQITVTSSKYLPYTEVIDLPYDAGSQVVQRKVELSRDFQATVNGRVIDVASNIPLAGEVEFLELGSLEVVKLSVTNKKGEYDITLPPGRDYQIRVKSVGYTMILDTVKIGADMKGQEISKSFSLKKLDRDLMSVLKGRIYNAETGDSINAQISITEYGGIPVLLYQKPGVYDCVVFNGAVYNITVNAEGYLTHTAQITVPEGADKKEIIHDVQLIRAEKGAKIVLNNIFFDFNKSTLRPNSYKSLNTLLSTMKRYPMMAIEISGHTDNVGTMTFNQRLSDARANVVRDFLVRNGIEAKRVGAFGRSYRQPIASNDSAQGRQLNRRTEIKILKLK
jgi:outer membrane protein OmpA-like peptidoglycan-associated protein/tetratricopeptide (TPR) repeat protein